MYTSYKISRNLYKESQGEKARNSVLNEPADDEIAFRRPNLSLISCISLLY